MARPLKYPLSIVNYLQPEGDCLVWAGKKDKAGYARAGVQYVHVRAWEEANGRKAAGHIHHTCRNRACGNPAHLQELDPAAHGEAHRSGKWTAEYKRNYNRQYMADYRALSRMLQKE